MDPYFREEWHIAERTKHIEKSGQSEESSPFAQWPSVWFNSLCDIDKE